jgi:hypothetical protein
LRTLGIAPDAALQVAQSGAAKAPLAKEKL